MSVCGRLQQRGPARRPRNDHCVVAIDADILVGWRLLRLRRLSAQGECRTGGDAFAEVAATFTASIVLCADEMIE
jgi:hypothetical protein